MLRETQIVDPVLDAVAQWPFIERVHVAVFLDQMVRNAKAIGSVPHGLLERADAAAVKLATAVAAEVEAQVEAASQRGESGADNEDEGGGGSGGGSRAALSAAAAAAAAAAETAETAATTTTPTPPSSPLMTAAEFCFFTLVLRHTRRPDLMQQSLELLQNALNGNLSKVVSLNTGTGGEFGNEGGGEGGGGGGEGGEGEASGVKAGPSDDGSNETIDEAEDPGRWLVGRFVEETEDSIMGVAADAYIERALSTDRPTLLNVGTCTSSCDTPPSFPPPTLLPRTEHHMRVLDKRCIELVQNNPAGFLPLFDTANPGAGAGAGTGAVAGAGNDSGHARVPAAGPDHPLYTHWVTAALAETLTKAGVGPGHTLLLSLSGGVDSMAHAVMLRLLQPTFGYDLCALHIRHPNRDDAIDEEEWVQHAAAKIGIELYSYQVQLQRPHGNKKTGISREKYESVTKKIRFRMYEVLAAAVGRRDRTAYVVIGHHMDDTDENRLSELGKSNIVNVNGMHTLSECLGMTVFRPLLSLRKVAMIEFANAAKFPYMADSTPPWSRRGWTRRVLDECAEEVRVPLLHALNELGDESERLALEIDRRLGESGSKVLHGTLPAPVAEFLRTTTPRNGEAGGGGAGSSRAEGEGDKSSSSSSSRIIGDGKVVFVDLGDLENFVAALEPSIKKVFASVAAVADVWNAAVKEQIAATAVVYAAEGNLGPPPTCPLQPIKLHTDKKFDAGAFLFATAVKDRLREPSVKPFLRGAQVAGRALTHLWRSLTQKKKGGACAIWGQMHQSCPIAWPLDRPGILFYPFESYEPVMALEPNGPGRRHFLAHCFESISISQSLP